MSILKMLGVVIGGLYVGFSLARGAMQVLAPTIIPVPCYDFMDATPSVLVLFNKCTGTIETRLLTKKAPPPPPASTSGAFLGPKVGA